MQGMSREGMDAFDSSMLNVPSSHAACWRLQGDSSDRLRNAIELEAALHPSRMFWTAGRLYPGAQQIPCLSQPCWAVPYLMIVMRAALCHMSTSPGFGLLQMGSAGPGVRLGRMCHQLCSSFKSHSISNRDGRAWQ